MDAVQVALQEEEKEEEQGFRPSSAECRSTGKLISADWGGTGKPWVNSSLQKYYTRLEFHATADSAEEEGPEAAACSMEQAQLQGYP